MAFNSFGRHNPFAGLLAILLVAFLIFASYSFYKGPMLAGLKRSSIASCWYGDTLSRPALFPIIETDTIQRIDSSKQSILLIGDSMLEGLSPRFFEYAKYNGHDFNAVLWYSSHTKYFGQCDTLTYFIRKYRPTFIIISLGSNELFVRNIKKERAPYVAHIIKEIDTIPFVWIGPPNWRTDTGINELIEEYVGSKRYYPSLRLTFERSKDGAHPTHRSAARWADSVSRWIMDSSAHKILLKQPDSTIKHGGNGIKQLLKPLR